MTNHELYELHREFKKNDNVVKIELIDGEYVIGKLKGFISEYDNDDGEGASIWLEEPPYNTFDNQSEYYATNIVSIELYNPEEE